VPEINDGGAPVRSVLESYDIGVAAQELLHDLALHSGTAAVNDAHQLESFLHRLKKVFLDHTVDFPRPEGVQVDRIFNRYLNRLLYQSLAPAS